MLLYYHGFRFFNMGYASAMAVLLLVVAFAATSLIIRGSRRRVHYGTTPMSGAAVGLESSGSPRGVRCRRRSGAGGC